MPMMTEALEALADNYLGIGSTPQGALAALAEDLVNERLNPEDLSLTAMELLEAIGLLLSEIVEKLGLQTK